MERDARTATMPVRAAYHLSPRGFLDKSPPRAIVRMLDALARGHAAGGVIGRKITCPHLRSHSPGRKRGADRRCGARTARRAVSPDRSLVRSRGERRDRFRAARAMGSGTGTGPYIARKRSRCRNTHERMMHAVDRRPRRS
jgi:hypothetical protein